MLNNDKYLYIKPLETKLKKMSGNGIVSGLVKWSIIRHWLSLYQLMYSFCISNARNIDHSTVKSDYYMWTKADILTGFGLPWPSELGLQV